MAREEFDVDMYDDDYGDQNTSTNRTNEAAGEDRNVERSDALYVRGVDDMSTDNLQAYLDLYIPQSQSAPRIEWIDDTSVVVVFPSSDEAKSALDLLSLQSIEQVDTNNNGNNKLGNRDEREAKANTIKGGSLQIRTARKSDKKERGAKDRSRWYLFHPEDDPDNRIHTKIHSSRGGSRMGGVRLREGRDLGPYSRARPTRRREDPIELFADKMKDLGAISSKDEDQGSRSDLFADRLDPQSSKKSRGLFADRIGHLTRPTSSSSSPISSVREDRHEQTLAQRIADSPTPQISLNDDQVPKGTSLAGKELFGDRIKGGGDLASRIEGGPCPIRRNQEIRIRGVGRNSRNKAHDLF